MNAVLCHCRLFSPNDHGLATVVIHRFELNAQRANILTMVTVGVTTWFYISIYPIALAFTFSNSAKDNFKSFCCSFATV